ncbi:UNVERIFIED_CONTAM: Nudix hydrolase 16, mitochondrial [Sesamum calycinum]|uniref:Nudix hydrolase 16, mitochondrial n=1 Tax=Sesamum calycinum TaxID=2727403 RepID=A0AAW2JAZ1_9LAMI
MSDAQFLEGGWENDETVQEAALREAIEEAGVRGKIVKFLGYYEFKSKTHQDEYSPEGWCRAAMFAMLVEEELRSWPEQNTRSRKWLTVSEAANSCRHPWMRDALIGGFSDETTTSGGSAAV